MFKIVYFILISLICFIITEDSINYIIDNIYLGDSEAASDEEFLKHFNISTVINCAEELTSEYRDLNFLELQLSDDYDQNLFPKFEEAYKYIKLHSEKNVFIHCSMGMSRSASLVIFYIMKEKGWNFNDCLNYIRERRPIVCPNDGFEKQLRHYYEKYINNENF